MLLGLKTVIWCVNNYRIPKDAPSSIPSTPKESTPSSLPGAESYKYKFTDYERDLVSKYLVWGLECLRIYRVPPPTSPPPSTLSVTPSTPHELKAISEYREVLDSFAASFTVLDLYNLLTIVGLHIGGLFDALLEDPQIMAFPQNLLVHPQVSQTFAEVVLNFLMARIDELGEK